MDLNAVGPEQIALFAAPVVLLVALLVWLLLRRTRVEYQHIIDRFNYTVFIRRIRLDRRYRSGRAVVAGTGSFGARQGARTPLGLESYNASDELGAVGLFDLDSQQAHRSVDSLPAAVGVVSVFPSVKQLADGHRVEQGSETGVGLSHRSMAEVEKLRYLWEPPLLDFLVTLDRELQRGATPVPPIVLFFASPCGHALLGCEAIGWLRRRYPSSPIYGVTIVPQDDGNRAEFADLLAHLTSGPEHDLDGLIVTDNRLPNYFLHDDMLAHLLGIAFQGARERGANPANVFADATIPRRSDRRRMRIYTIEYGQTDIVMLEPDEPGLLARILGRRGQPDTDPAAVVARGAELALRMVEKKGILAGPAPLSALTRTALFLGLPHNGTVSFAKIVQQVKARFESSKNLDPNRLHFMIGQLFVPELPADEGAPVVAIRLGEIGMTSDELIAHLRAVVVTSRPSSETSANGHQSWPADESVTAPAREA